LAGLESCGEKRAPPDRGTGCGRAWGWAYFVRHPVMLASAKGTVRGVEHCRRPSLERQREKYPVLGRTSDLYERRH
jgi:hypothetical protein